MNDKTLIGIGIAAVATPVMAFWIFNGAGHSAAPAPAAGAVSQAAQPTVATLQKGTTISTLTAPPAAAGVPAGGIQVTPADQEKLAQMVGLSDKPDQPLNKEKWEKAIPIAQKLANQSADCEQRNWLNQFVVVGNMAIEGSPDFQKYAPVLATMCRDEKELLTGQPSN
jgi:hypothetical protein